MSNNKKKYSKDHFKILREQSSQIYDSVPALNWGETIDEKYGFSDRYNFKWRFDCVEEGGLVFIEEDIKEHILKFIEENNKKIKAYIGVDSQNHLSFTRFVAVIVLHVERNGAHVLISRFDLPKIYDFRYRLLREVDVIGELARKFEWFFKENDIELELHSDLNNSSNHKSNGVVVEAKNYIKNLGFDLKIKPAAFAASYCADNFCK